MTRTLSVVSAYLVLAIAAATSSSATSWQFGKTVGAEDFGNNSGEVWAATTLRSVPGTVSPDHVGWGMSVSVELRVHGLTCGSSFLVGLDLGGSTVTAAGGNLAVAHVQTGDCCKPSGHFQLYSATHSGSVGLNIWSASGSSPSSGGCFTGLCFWDSGGGPL